MTSIGDNSNLDEVGGISQEQNPTGEAMEREDSVEIAESGETTDEVELDEATLDPAALIEAQQEYGQAEAIESALTDLVVSGDSEGANAPATEELDVEVEGLVGQVRAGYDSEGSSQGNVETEIAQGYDELDREGSSKGNVEITSGHDAGDPVPLEELTYDHKPIPADEGTVDLDGKGNDIRFDPEVKLDQDDRGYHKLDAQEGVIPDVEMHDERAFKFDPEEGALPKIDSEEGIVLGGIDTLDSGEGFVDFKFFRSDAQVKLDSDIAKDPAYLEGMEPSQSLESALGRAVTDPAFRQELMENAQDALTEYDLSTREIELLSQIDPDGLQQVAEQIKSQFENLDNPTAQTVLGRIITNVLSGGSGVVKGE
jgi:hypothetical protein